MSLMAKIQIGCRIQAKSRRVYKRSHATRANPCHRVGRCYKRVSTKPRAGVCSYMVAIALGLIRKTRLEEAAPRLTTTSRLYVRQNRRRSCTKVGQVLPERGIELKWFRGQSLIPKFFAKVSTPFPISYNTGFKKICIGRFVFRSETYGFVGARFSSASRPFRSS
jgi:hypothetical protein